MNVASDLKHSGVSLCGGNKSTIGVGTILDGRYELLREIARGAMGVVFGARHVVTGRRVAVKVMSPDLSHDRSMRARFEREARCLGAIDHPGVVSILDAGGIETEPYLVLEMLEGRTLEGLLLVRRTLPPKVAVAIALELCEALEQVHAAGVVHRDIKPSNVFLAIDALGQETVKIIDFGIATLDASHEPPASSDSRTQKLTRPGTLLGTPEYMALEQLMGHGADERSDVYALGVMLFEMLTGSVPFPGSYPEVLLAVERAKTPPSVCSFRSELSPELAEVIASALCRLPEERHQTFIGFARELRALKSLTVQEAPPLPPRPVEAERSTEMISSVSSAEIASRLAAYRRRFVRRPYKAPVIVHCDGEAIRGHSEDISEGGMLVVVTSLCPDGAEVELEVGLPNCSDAVRLTAIARWTKSGRRGGGALGIELVKTPLAAREAIRAYVDAGRQRVELRA